MALATGALVSVAMLGSAEAASTPKDLAAIRRLAIQHNGRFKPFDSFARETLAHITGSPRHGGQDPVETVLQILASPEPWQAKPLIAIPFRPLREPLGLGLCCQHFIFHAVALAGLPALDREFFR